MSEIPQSVQHEIAQLNSDLYEWSGSDVLRINALEAFWTKHTSAANERIAYLEGSALMDDLLTSRATVAQQAATLSEARTEIADNLIAFASMNAMIIRLHDERDAAKGYSDFLLEEISRTRNLFIGDSPRIGGDALLEIRQEVSREDFTIGEDRVTLLRNLHQCREQLAQQAATIERLKEEEERFHGEHNDYVDSTAEKLEQQAATIGELREAVDQVRAPYSFRGSIAWENLDAVLAKLPKEKTT